jgi:hypothetical protein
MIMKTRADLMKDRGFSSLDTDTCGNPIVWENSYECPACGEIWDDTWSCGCDDDCPNCGTTVAPYRMDWLPAGKGEPGAPLYDMWFALPESGTDNLNMLSHGETIASVIARDGCIGIDVLFCRNISDNPDETDFMTCAPEVAEIATVYIITREGISSAVHDVDLTEAGADSLAATCKALFLEICTSRRPNVTS